MEGSKDKAALLQRIAKEGDLDELQRALSQNGHAWDARICAAAAGIGHLEMWCRSNNCPWAERTCAKAAKGATWKCFSGAGPTAVLGMSERAPRLQGAAIWNYSSGAGPTAVLVLWHAT